MIYCTINQSVFGERPVLFQECLLSSLLGLDLVVGIQAQGGHCFLGFFCCFCESREDFCSLDWLFGFFKLNHWHTEVEEGLVVLHLLLFSLACSPQGFAEMMAALSWRVKLPPTDPGSCWLGLGGWCGTRALIISACQGKALSDFCAWSVTDWYDSPCVWSVEQQVSADTLIGQATVWGLTAMSAMTLEEQPRIYFQWTNGISYYV